MEKKTNIGERINFFRRLHNYTQKELGELLGFSAKTCDVRVAQYETGDRVPKEDMLKKIANIFGISLSALQIPDISNWVKRMHLFFAMEDKYGAEIRKIDGEYYLRIEAADAKETAITGVRNAILQEWVDKYSALQKGEITKAEYDKWRYNYPQKGAYGVTTFRRNDEEEVAWFPDKYYSLINMQQDVQNAAAENKKIEAKDIAELKERYKITEELIQQQLADLRQAIEKLKPEK